MKVAKLSKVDAQKAAKESFGTLHAFAPKANPKELAAAAIAFANAERVYRSAKAREVQADDLADIVK
jgi:hypothetical protein